MSDAASPVSLLVFGGGWLGRAAALEAVRQGGRAVADRTSTRLHSSHVLSSAAAFVL